MIDSTQQTGTKTDTPTTTTTQKQDKLGSQAFLQLLIVQLQNQDPTAPQSNTEFIAQLATFSQLEQLTSINTAVTAMSKFFGTTTSGSNSSTTPSK